MFSDVWSENAVLFKRLMKIHSNPPIYYGFKDVWVAHYFLWHISKWREFSVCYFWQMVCYVHCTLPDVCPSANQFKSNGILRLTMLKTSCLNITQQSNISLEMVWVNGVVMDEWIRPLTLVQEAPGSNPAVIALGRFRTGMSRTTYKILQHFPVWWPYIKKEWSYILQAWDFLFIFLFFF